MHPRIPLLLAVAFCISACPKGPPADSRQPLSEVQRLSADVKDLSTQAEALLEHIRSAPGVGCMPWAVRTNSSSPKVLRSRASALLTVGCDRPRRLATRDTWRNW